LTRIAPDMVVCREIAASDLDAVAHCLARNFRRRGLTFWKGALRRLASAPAKLNAPRFGRLLDADGDVVGVLLEIGHASDLQGAPAPRCNFSSWCADAPYRGFAMTLSRQGLRRADVTYLNLTPAPHTIPIVETFGFRLYAKGAFVATPWRNAPIAGMRLIPFDAESREAAGLSAWERAMLTDHQRWGLDALIGVSDEGVTPFALRNRPLWRHWIPATQLIYSRSERDLVRFAHLIGRFCLRRGRAHLFVNANGPIQGLAGGYVQGRDPRYFRGSAPPALTDLAYTELALL
jgi:hypothetical protein